MKEQKSPKKSLIYYYVIALVVLLFTSNALVFPSIFGTRVTEVSDDAFLAQLEAGKIT